MIGKRFRVLHQEELPGKDNDKAIVLVDRETGVNYLWVQSPAGTGLTMLVDKEGHPLVSKLAGIKD